MGLGLGFLFLPPLTVLFLVAKSLRLVGRLDEEEGLDGPARSLSEPEGASNGSSNLERTKVLSDRSVESSNHQFPHLVGVLLSSLLLGLNMSS